MNRTTKTNVQSDTPSPMAESLYRRLANWLATVPETAETGHRALLDSPSDYSDLERRIRQINRHLNHSDFGVRVAPF